MNEHGLVVVGSGPAGVSAAEAFREHEFNAPIRIITADPDQPYERPPLSKDFLRGETDDVWLHDAAWFDDHDVEIHRGAVRAVDVAAHAITIDDGPMPYGALVLACGAGPSPLPTPGGDRALSLRSLTDARRLRDTAEGARTAVVVGAGFIGCEAAASLAMRGIEVVLVAPSSAPQEKRLGAEAGRRLKDLVTASGARYLGGTSVAEVLSGGVRLDDGRTLPGDLVLAATGVTPRAGVAEASGLDVEQGRIVVDAHLRTSAEDVFAAGDVALAHNATAGRPIAVEHWGDAMSQGAVAGAEAAGVRASWAEVPGFWTTIGDATVKYSAWGDGYDDATTVDHGDGFTVWYVRHSVTVGVLTHDADGDHDLGRQLIESRSGAPV